MFHRHRIQCVGVYRAVGNHNLQLYLGNLTGIAEHQIAVFRVGGIQRCGVISIYSGLAGFRCTDIGVSFTGCRFCFGLCLGIGLFSR